MGVVVVTGADGFIGSHFVRYCSEQGFDVYAVIMPGSSTVERIKGIPNVTLIHQELSVYSIFSKSIPQKPLAVLHLAWNGVAPEQRNSTFHQELLCKGWSHHLIHMTAVHLWQNGTLQLKER